MWYINVDGASRGNPGKAGVGIVIKQSHLVCFKEGYSVGTMTNNQAEYWSLIIALAIFVHEYKNDQHLVIRSDSQLLVNQLNGLYAVKNQELKVLYKKVEYFLQKIPKYSIEHVYREQNILADEQANFGIDQNISVPAQVRRYLTRL
jgi:ribonuclease HI